MSIQKYLLYKISFTNHIYYLKTFLFMSTKLIEFPGLKKKKQVTVKHDISFKLKS